MDSWDLNLRDNEKAMAWNVNNGWKKKILKLNVNDAKHNTGWPKKTAPKVQLVISHLKHLIRPLYWIYTMELL